MKRSIQAVLICLTVLLVFAACAIAEKTLTPTSIPTATTEVDNQIHVTRLPPTAALPDQPVIYDGLQVSMNDAEITGEYITEYGISRVPPASMRFLWVRITIKNLDQQAKELPALEHFSVVYHGIEYKAIYGHRQDHVDYTSLATIIYPAQAETAWLRFDIPEAAELSLLQFAYLTDSSRVSFPFIDYPWQEHAIHLWQLLP